MWDAILTNRVISSMPSYSFQVVSLKTAVFVISSGCRAICTASWSPAALWQIPGCTGVPSQLAHGHGGAGGQSEASISRIQSGEAQIQEQKVWWPKCLTLSSMRISSLMWNLSFGFTHLCLASAETAGWPESYGGADQDGGTEGDRLSWYCW